MRFIVMHKTDPVMEAGGPPDQSIIQNMGALVQESIKSGVFTNGAGLHPSSRRVRLQCRSGEWSVTRGPYAGQNELVAAVTMISAKSLDAAVQHAKRLGSALGDCEIEVGPVVEPWDLGLIPKPENAPERFLLLTKSTAEDEAASGSAARHAAATAQLVDSLGDAGAVLAAETFAPSSRGNRLPAGPKAKRVWVDGPFAESKELISGFSLLKLDSKAEALAWAERYAEILGEKNEVDIRIVNEA
jgi:hypothetical protein